MLCLAASLIGAAFLLEGQTGVADGFSNAIGLAARAMPFLIFGFGLAGMITVLVPPSTMGRWMGEDSGARGLTIGMAAGAVSPGGPYVVYPIAAAFLSGGAGLGPMAGFLGARNLVTLNRLLIWDIPFVGASFAITRILVSIWLPFVSIALLPIVYRLLPDRLGGPDHLRAEQVESSPKGEKE